MISDTLIVISTFSKRHIYLPEVLAISRENMRFAKDFVVITDSPIVLDCDVIVARKDSWCEVLYEGLMQICDKYAVKHIFLMLEDLIPFERVDGIMLEKNYDLMLKNEFKFLSFRTYEYDKLSYDYTIDKLTFCKLPFDFDYYCQLQPAFWNVDYLLAILQDLINSNMKTAWQFEFYRTKEIHLMSNYKWPNVLGGFIEGGQTNNKAISAMKSNPIMKSLRIKLIKNYIKERPIILYRKIKSRLK